MRKKDLEAAPLYYWEEESYMMVVPETEDDDLLKKALNNLKKSREIKMKDNHFDVNTGVIFVTIEYEKKDYEIGLFIGGISVPDYYVNSFLFENEKAQLLSAKQALTIFMEFTGDAKKCFHLELKLATILVPNQIGILDESAEKMLPAKWVQITASSHVIPSSKYLFSVQAIKGEKGRVWLHTHGLCRCGISELEILDSNETNRDSHYNLLVTYGMYLLDKENSTIDNTDGSYIGNLIDGSPIVVTKRPWTEGIQEYKKLDLGGIKDRQNGHNSNTSIIFLYTSEEDEKKGNIKKVSIYDELWSDNPLYFYSDEETFRMKSLAIERYDYIKKGFKDKDNTVLIKVGLPLEKPDKFEHIWFKLLEIKKDKFKAELTQEPYYFENLHTGYVGWYTKEDITDWIIYTPNYPITPDTAFLLDD